jgi:hypothetical protein
LTDTCESTSHQINEHGTLVTTTGRDLHRL